LNDTRGIELVKVVISIHNRLKAMARLTGCLNIEESKLFSVASLIKKMSNTPTSIGSVGRYISNSSPGITSLRGILKGITNITNKYNLSNA